MVTAHCQGCVLQKTASLLLTILEDLARRTLPNRQAAIFIKLKMQPQRIICMRWL